MAIKGAAKVQAKLSGAASAFDGLSDEIAAIGFDPKDSASVEQAIASMEAVIDARMRKHRDNPIVRMAGDGLKEQYRELIRARASE